MQQIICCIFSLQETGASLSLNAAKRNYIQHSTKEYKVMKTVQISLNSIDKVKAFVNDITKFDNDFDLVSGRYVIDAKSIMGIFSLDLSKPIDLSIHAEENLDEILETLKPYMI